MTTETKKSKFRTPPPPVLRDRGPQPQTQRRFRPPSPYKDRIMRIAEQKQDDLEKLNKMKDDVRDMMEKFMEGSGSTAGKTLRRFGAKKGGKMSSGGEVDIDMTTEMDV
tara:strand:+ start:48 stop:374 length:327 start_codon:yes stop_codon:yes gene_type:complete